MKTFAYRLCLLGAVGLALGAAAHAQSKSAAIRGKVTDATGGVVPGATLFKRAGVQPGQ